MSPHLSSLRFTTLTESIKRNYLLEFSKILKLYNTEFFRHLFSKHFAMHQYNLKRFIMVIKYVSIHFQAFKALGVLGRIKEVAARMGIFMPDAPIALLFFIVRKKEIMID